MAGEGKNEVVIPDAVRVAMQLESIFMPRATKHRQRLYAGGDSARFVHYTSAEAALSIIKSKRVWMRTQPACPTIAKSTTGFRS